MALMRKFSNKDQKGITIMHRGQNGLEYDIPEEKVSKYLAEQEKLRQKKVTIEVVPVKMSYLQVLDGVTPNVIAALEPMIVDEWFSIKKHRAGEFKPNARNVHLGRGASAYATAGPW